MEDNKRLMEEILARVHHIAHLSPEDFPELDLYMDQVTTFMESKLSSTRRYPDDKVLTKTMINNYAKNSLLPPPEKKRYSRDHLLVLVFIYYFKNILSIKDIQAILGPVTDLFFHGPEGRDMRYVYEKIFHLEEAETLRFDQDVRRAFELAKEAFPEEENQGEDAEALQRFALVCLLSYDVYMKKVLIEHLIDDLTPPEETGKEKKEKKKKKRGEGKQPDRS